MWNKYLGVEVGRPRTGTISDTLRREIDAAMDKILESRLTDWQKIDAINIFALSTISARSQQDMGLARRRHQEEDQEILQTPSQDCILRIPSVEQHGWPGPVLR